MFVNWLFTVFPVEIRTAWSRLRPDLLLWIAIATASAVLTGVTASTHGRPPATLLILQTLGPILVTFLVAALLDAQEENRSRGAAELSNLLARRGPQLFWFAVLATLFTRVPQSIALFTADALLRGTPMGHSTASAFSLIIYVSLLARVCLTPYFVVLNRAAELRDTLLPKSDGLRKAMRLIWALLASDRSTDGVRWRLAPYLVLPYLCSVGVSLSPQAAQLPALALAEFIKLLCYAVLFGYFVQRRSAVLRPRPAA